MPARDYDALAAFFVLGWRRAAADRATTFGRVSLLVVILCIFWAMWNATPLRELGAGRLTAGQLFWYLAATEVVAMSVGFPYRVVEADIQSGEMASSFVRPVHYALATLADWIGDTTYRFIAVVAASIICGLWVTHSLPVTALTGIFLIAALWIGCVLLLLSQLCIGLLATWMKSAAPAFWIWQKLFFVLGGLIIPLTLYPAWLAVPAQATPFAAMLFLPASLTFNASASSIIHLFIAQFCWVTAMSLLTWFLYRCAERHLRIHGA